jgi:hypothetical protein
MLQDKIKRFSVLQQAITGWEILRVVVEENTKPNANLCKPLQLRGRD